MATLPGLVADVHSIERHPAPRVYAGPADGEPPDGRVAGFLARLLRAQEQFASAAKALSFEHLDDRPLWRGLAKLAELGWESVVDLAPFADQYGRSDTDEIDRLRAAVLPPRRAGGAELPRDLHGLYLLWCESHLALLEVQEAARVLEDEPLKRLCDRIGARAKLQRGWLESEVKARALAALR